MRSKQLTITVAGTIGLFMQLIDSTTFNNLYPTNPMMADRLLEKVDKFFHSMEPRWDKLETSFPPGAPPHKR